MGILRDDADTRTLSAVTKLELFAPRGGRDVTTYMPYPSLAFSHLIFPSVSEGYPVVVLGLLYFLHVVLLSLNVNLRD